MTGALLFTLPFVPKPVGNTVLLLFSFLMLLAGAKIFTNGVEWLGNRLGISESATGSILAAVGTALPETMIPVIAILNAQLNPSEKAQAAADSVGVGAILGAPFMLATIAMFMIGVSVIYFSDRRPSGRNFSFKAESTKRDLSFFLVGYSLAFLAALIQQTSIQYAIAGLLVVLYFFYLYRSLQSGELVETEELDDLMLGRLVNQGRRRVTDGGVRQEHAVDPPRILVVTQTLFALGIIIAGAHLFVTEVKWAAGAVGIPAAVISLMLAPLATELPEKFNSVIWISQDKDTLAIGNITGAMAFQGTLPVTLGIVFTSWNLQLPLSVSGLLHPTDPAGLLNGVSAIFAIVSGVILFTRARRVEGGDMNPRPFLLGGVFYAGFVGLLLYFVLTGQLTGAVAGH
ncbi:MAG: sodium:calcium antiporter [Halobacteriales archaeon]